MSDARPAGASRFRSRLGRHVLRDGLLAWGAATLIGALVIRSCVTLDLAPAPPAEAVGRAMAALRLAADGRPPGDLGIFAGLALPGAVRVTLWSQGLPAFREELDAPTLGTLVSRAAAGLAEARAAGRLASVELDRARFQLSFVVGRGPVLAWPTLAASLSFVTSLDGVALRLRDKTVRLYPDDLLRRRLYSAYLPLPGGQVEAGLDVPTAVESLWLAAHLPDAAWDEQHPSLERFRTAEFVERPGAEPAPLVGGRAINPPPRTVDDYRRVVLAGVRWLAAMLQPDGRFQYDYDPIADAPFDLGYSLPRHAGAAYFLARAHRRTGDPTARTAARRALDYVVAHELRACGAAPGRCVGSSGTVDAGSAALTVTAMAEYERGTSDGRYTAPLRQVLEFLLWLQEPDGDFVHVYDPDAGTRSPVRLPYYSGESVLGLVEAYRVLHDAALLPHIRAALDWLTKRNWSFFGSAYFYGEEHWTCIAAEEAFPEVQDPAYLDFCEGFSGFLRAMQTTEGEPPYGFEGVYPVLPLFAPRTTPVGGRTEATVATYKLGVAMGRPNPVVLEQIRSSLSFLVRMVYTEASSPLFAQPDRAAGGMPGGLDDPVVRIDYVQHAGNALLGGIDILGDYELGPP